MGKALGLHFAELERLARTSDGWNAKRVGEEVARLPDGGVAVPSMSVSLSTRSVPDPVASAIVRLPDALGAGYRPLVIATLSMRTSCPSNASPPPLASCDSVITCGTGAAACEIS